MKTHSCLTNKFCFICFSSSALTALAALNWVVLLLFSPGITHATAVLWQLFWGQMVAGGLAYISASRCWVSVGPCVFSSLALAFSWSDSITRKQFLCTSDFHISTYILFTEGLWTKASHVANLRVNLGRDYANTWVQEASFIGTITVTINHKL